MALNRSLGLACWLAVPLFGVACGDASRPPVAAPPIAGAVLDQIQKNVQQTLDRDFGGLRAERVRVERADDGARAVVHASLGAPLAEGDDQRLCGALAAAASGMLLAGQSIEIHLVGEGGAVRSCAPLTGSTKTGSR